jgi:Secretion system C-terminal sorting domain
MQKTFWTFLLLLLAQFGFAQDWRPLYANRTAYYAENWSGNVAIRWTLDHSRVDGADSIWYPEPLHLLDHVRWDSCYGFTPGPSPIGDSVRVFANGDMDFYHAGGDTLHWKADLTQPWVMLRSPVGNPRRIIATPAGYAVGTVLGQQDSILTLDLTMIDSVGATSQRTSKLSKHHGWLDPIQRLTAYGLPFEYHPNYNIATTSALKGITQPDLGVQNLPKEAFFTMQPGDTIQIWEHTSEDYLNEWTDIWQQDIYLARTTSANGDTLFFSIDRARAGVSNRQSLPPPSRSIVIDTIPLNTPAYQRLDRDLGEMYAPDFRASAWVPEWRIHAQYGRVMKPMSLRDTLNEIDSCYALAGRGYAGDEFWSSFFLECYMEGLGGPYWRKQFFLFDLFIKRDVSYFHTSTGQGGSPIDFDSLLLATSLAPPLESIAHAVQVIPNPNQGEFRIVLQAGLAQDVTHISILSADGRTCKRLDTQRNQELDVDAHDLPRGLYLLRVEAQDRQWLQKLMIR